MNNRIIRVLIQLKEQLTIESNNFLIESNTKKYIIYRYKLKVLENLIKIIRYYNKEIKINNVNELSKYNNIGKKSIDKIKEIIETGTLKILTNVKDISNNSIKELEKVYGIGKQQAIYYNIHKNIKSVAELIKKVKSGDIKVNNNILFGLKYYGKFFDNISRKEMDLYNKEFVNITNKCKSMICGSYRRNKNFMSDIDLLVICNGETTLDDYIDLIRNNKNLKLIDDFTKNYKVYYRGLIQYKNYKIRKIEITFAKKDIYTHILHLTGSAEFNKYIRKEAKKQGYKLSQHGLYKDNKKINIKSEKDIFDILNIKYIEPHNR